MILTKGMFDPSVIIEDRTKENLISSFLSLSNDSIYLSIKSDQNSINKIVLMNRVTLDNIM